MKIYSNYSLKDFNTFGIDVKTRQFIEYDSAEDVIQIQKKLQTPYIIIGRGSNLLFKKDYDGTVLHCIGKNINEPKSLEPTNVIEVDAGVIWDDFVDWSIQNGYSGAENLSLIPGEVGAAAVQNIGAYGAEVKDIIEWVEFVRLDTGKICKENVSSLKYGYRQSIFKQEWANLCAVTKVGLRLSRTFIPRLEYGALKSLTNKENLTPKDVREEVIKIRNQKLPDPKQIGNAGSFFMNPIVSIEFFNKLQSQFPDIPFYQQEGGVKIPAGWLIEQCGWKGKNLGKAGVYEKQALVLVNLGGAHGDDIIKLSQQIQNDVFNKYGIHIYPEVKFV